MSKLAVELLDAEDAPTDPRLKEFWERREETVYRAGRRDGEYEDVMGLLVEVALLDTLQGFLSLQKYTYDAGARDSRGAGRAGQPRHGCLRRARCDGLAVGNGRPPYLSAAHRPKIASGQRASKSSSMICRTASIATHWKTALV